MFSLYQCPAKIQPGRPISGLEALLRNIEYIEQQMSTTYTKELETIFEFRSVLGRFWDKAGPGTVTNGSGSTNAVVYLSCPTTKTKIKQSDNGSNPDYNEE